MALEPASAAKGTFSVAVDGDWDIEDLRALSEAFQESYGYFYPLAAPDLETAKKLHEIIQKRFWSGDIETKNFGQMLYRMIPDADGLKIRSIHYSSPGAFTFAGILALLLLLSRVVRSWSQTVDQVLVTYDKIEKFFEKRKGLRKAARKNNLDDQMVVNVNEARDLAMELGERFGFDAAAVERVIEIAGNPISALKYMAALAKEARKLSEMETAGLLKLPAPPDNQPLVLGPSTGRRVRGVQVTTLKSRARKKD